MNNNILSIEHIIFVNTWLNERRGGKSGKTNSNSNNVAQSVDGMRKSSERNGTYYKVS